MIQPAWHSGRAFFGVSGQSRYAGHLLFEPPPPLFEETRTEITGNHSADHVAIC